MNKLFFGTAGVPRSSERPDTISGMECIKSLGLDCMEIEFVRGVKMSTSLAKKVNQARVSLGIKLTVHAPYFINLASKDPSKVATSMKRILDSARIGALLGAESLTFHAGFYQGRAFDEVYQTIKNVLEKIIKQLTKNLASNKTTNSSIRTMIKISPETTGKPSQFGSLEETLKLAKELNIGICLDISHLHARTGGKYNTYQEFSHLWETIKQSLGKDSLNNMHLHISGIKYTSLGEKEHLNLRESDFNYQDFIKSLKDFNVGGVLICESPNLEGDALLLKKTYYT